MAQERRDDPKYLAAFAFLEREWSTDELLTTARAVAALKESPGWTVIQSVLEQRERAIMDPLIDGRIRHQAEYAAKTGMCSGMRQARYAVDAIVELGRRKEAELEKAEREEGAN